MTFLNSIWFWGGMALIGIAIPVIIHLFSRYRSRPVEWAAMELLRKAMAVRARRLKMEDLILLLLRASAMGLIALALSRPALTPSSSLRWAGGGKESARAGVLVAVDGSFSMMHKSGVRSRFDLAIDRVRSILDTMSPGDPLTIVVMGSRPRVILRNVAYEPGRVGATLKALKPLAEELDLAACFAEMRELMSEIKAPSRECHLVTDAQVLSWKDVPDGVRTALRDLQALGTVFILPAGSAGCENVAVTQLTASGLLKRGSVVRYVADVRNTGLHPVRDVSVRLVVNGMPVDRQLLENLTPGQTAAVSLFAAFEREGMFTVEATIGDDSLSLDNTRYVLADIRSEVKVLCVDGDPSEQAFRGAADFLAAALQPELRKNGLSGGIKVTRVSYGSMRISELTKYDIVIMANVPQLPREYAYALGNFVRTGGGLMVFLGDNTNPDMSNIGMRCADGSPLLPGKIKEITGVPDNSSSAKAGWSINTSMGDHPVTRVFSTMPPEQWNMIRFQRYVKTVPNENARVLMRMLPGDDPLLLSRHIGRGQVLLFTSSANREWNDMVVHPAYLMMVQQAVMTLTRKLYEVPLTVSQPLVFELHAEGAPSALTVLDPAKKEMKVHVTQHDGRLAAVVNAADLPGVYELKWEKETVAPKLAVNVSPAESSLAVLRGDALAVAASRLSLRVIDEQDDVGEAVRACRVGREIWQILMIAALFALLLEMLLARWFVKKMTVIRDEKTSSAWIKNRMPEGTSAKGA